MNLPKGIRLRGNSYFWDLTVKGQRVTGTCTTLAEAQTAREQAKKGLRKGSAPEPWILDKAFDKAIQDETAVWAGVIKSRHIQAQ